MKHETDLRKNLYRSNHMFRDILIGILTGYILGRVHENPDNIRKTKEFVEKIVDEVIRFIESHKGGA